MVDSISKRIADALSGKKDTVIKRKKDERSDREKKLAVKEGKQDLTSDERKELFSLVAARRSAKIKKEKAARR